MFPRRTKLPDPSKPAAEVSLHRSKQTQQCMNDVEYWRRLCPELHVNDVEFQKIFISPTKLEPERQGEVKDLIQDEGYARLSAKEMDIKIDPTMLARSLVQLMQHGWPASFFSVYDEAWALVHQVSEVMRSGSGGNVCNMDLLAWYIDPNSDQAGFSPHRDRQPDDSPASFRADGTPMYSTCWIPFTDACPENSCLYVLPRAHDPGYFVGDDDASEVDPLPLALSSKQSYQNVRAIPLEAGGGVMFTHRIIHWGSRGRKGYHTPRVSFSFGCSGPDEDWEPAYFDRSHLPFPSLELRTALASAQLVVYHERFEIDRKQLLLYHNTFLRLKKKFSSKYQKEVTKEFVNATKEVIPTVSSQASEAHTTQENSACERVDVIINGEDSGSEDEMMDQALEAMLDAEIGGFGDDIEDDFDSLHAGNIGDDIEKYSVSDKRKDRSKKSKVKMSVQKGRIKKNKNKRKAN